MPRLSCRCKGTICCAFHADSSLSLCLQDPANYREALREARLDEAEGADIMMVKPGLPYLDIIRLLRDNSTLPIAAYHVSGGVSTFQYQDRKPLHGSSLSVLVSDLLYVLLSCHGQVQASCTVCSDTRRECLMNSCICPAGEYAMLKAAAERGWLNERDAVLEALLSLRRAGSDLILTYYATQAAKWMAGEQ